jgi:hypothetical protein
MFDDYDFVMESLADDLEIANEFVSNAQAKMLGNRAQQVQNYRNAAGLQGKTGSATLSGQQVQHATNSNAPKPVTTQPTPPQPRQGSAWNQFNQFAARLSGKSVQNNANTAKPVATTTTASTAPAPKQAPAATTTSTTSTQAPKPAQPASTSSTPAPARKPMVYGSPEYNKTAKQFGIKDDSQKSTAELQSESKARMGRINDLVAQLHNKTPMQKKVEASQAHYNALTYNGTQSVPAGSKPTTTWSNTGDANAARAAGTAQRNEMFNTKPAASTTTTPSTTTSTTSSAPQPGQNIAKTK